MIVISQYGPFFWGRHAAEAAQEQGRLSYFFCTNDAHTRIPRHKKKCCYWRTEFLPRLMNFLARKLKLSRFSKLSLRLQRGIKVKYDRSVAKRLTSQTKIFHAISSRHPVSLEKCQDLGIRKVLDWSIAHPRYMNRLLKEEAKLLQVTPNNLVDEETALAELEKADHVIVPSTFVLETFQQEQFPTQNFTVIPFGVDLRHFKPLPPRKAQGPLRIAAISVSLRKGTYYVLEAVKQLKDKGCDLELYLFGDPDPNTQALAEKYRPYIHHMGGVPHTELAEWYADMDIMVMPSLIEGMARVVIEAMACGLPCIVTPNCGYGGIIEDGENGYVIPIRREDMLQDRLQAVYENREVLSQMSENALATAQKNTWDHYKARVAGFYDEILGSPGRS